MTVDFLAKERHFVDHLAPVWRAMDGSRGTFYTLGDAATSRARELGIEPFDGIARSDEKTVVASIGDLKNARAVGRRVALMEHGCGLSYGGDRTGKLNNSYAGGEGRPAELFLHPGPHPAARDRAKYSVPVHVVGSPRLDDLPERERLPEELGLKPVVAVSFHWDCGIAPETRTAFIYYRAFVQDLQKYFRVIGHGHPRIFDRLKIWYDRHGIEAVEDFDEVCRRADLYAVDNSSTLYEFASTGRPVLVLNAPFYRRDVSHGLRFWDAADVGVQCDLGIDLLKRAVEALSYPEALREAALDKVYAYRSGAADRAAQVLKEWS